MNPHSLNASPLGRPEQVWRLVSPDTAWRRFGDEFAVFDPASGDTHLLASVQIRLVEHLSRGSARVDALLDAAAGDAPGEPLACLHATLEALYALDLIEPAGE